MRTQPGPLPVDENAPGGDPIGPLYRERHDAMVRLAWLVTGSRAIGEEIAQEAFAQLLRRGTGADNPAAYLRATVMNLSRNYLRRARLERRLPPPAPLVQAAPELDHTWAAVAGLPYPQRAVLVLRYHLDLPEAEIAAALGCRVGTVKSRMHRALATLRKELT